MSTKSAAWSKWPSKWLKTLPNPALEGSADVEMTLGIGSLAESREGSPKGSKGAPAPILRFEDFVERPLRSIAQRHEE